jgi:hypothetical protein
MPYPQSPTTADRQIFARHNCQFFAAAKTSVLPLPNLTLALGKAIGPQASPSVRYVHALGASHVLVAWRVRRSSGR